MKRIILALACIVALAVIAAPAQAASTRHGKTCSIRAKSGKCLKAGRTCRFRSHGKWHTYYFCKRHKPQVVVVHDTQTVIVPTATPAAPCNCPAPPTCSEDCGGGCHSCGDEEHGDHGDKGHGHEDHGHKDKGGHEKGDCD